jgi:hypothetical protein
MVWIKFFFCVHDLSSLFPGPSRGTFLLEAY